MKGVHLPATAEAKGFKEAIGLNSEQMHGIVCRAAGWNVQLKVTIPTSLELHLKTSSLS